MSHQQSTCRAINMISKELSTERSNSQRCDGVTRGIGCQMATHSPHWSFIKVCSVSPSLFRSRFWISHARLPPTKGQCMSYDASPLPPGSFSHLDVVYTTELLHTRERVFSSPAHQYDAAMHEEWRVATWKAPTPSPKGHNDLKHFGS